MEQPQVSGTVLGTKGVKREGNNKFTSTGTLKSSKSMTDDNQANSLSAFSEINKKAVWEMRQQSNSPLTPLGNLLTEINSTLLAIQTGSRLS